MRKYLPHSIIIITILVALVFLFPGVTRSFLSPENVFRIADTAAVNRIEILSRDTVILTRKGGTWTLNENVPVSRVAVDNFLFTFSRMAVKGIISNPAYSDEKALRVKITEGRKKHFLRFYEISGQAFMHKEGSGNLYAVEVSGFPDLKPGSVIVADPDHWSDRLLLNLRPGEIKELSMLHPNDPESNFTIRNEEGKIALYDGNGVAVSEELTNSEAINFYLSYFTGIFYDGSAGSAETATQDPKWILRIEDTRGKKYELMVYQLKTPEGTDMFKALVKYNGQKGYKLARFMVLDLLLQDKGHFLVDEFSE